MVSKYTKYIKRSLSLNSHLYDSRSHSDNCLRRLSEDFFKWEHGCKRAWYYTFHEYRICRITNQALCVQRLPLQREIFCAVAKFCLSTPWSSPPHLISDPPIIYGWNRLTQYVIGQRPEWTWRDIQTYPSGIGFFLGHCCSISTLIAE